MSNNTDFNPSSYYYLPTEYPIYYPPLSQSQYQMPNGQQQTNYLYTYPNQHLASSATHEAYVSSLIPSHVAQVEVQAAPQKRTSMTIDSKDISTAYLDNLSEKFPDLEKLIITNPFLNISYKIYKIDNRSEAIRSIEINEASTEIIINSQTLSDNSLYLLATNYPNLEKLIITQPFLNRRYEIQKPLPRVSQITRIEGAVEELTSQLQTLQIDTTSTQAPIQQDIKENSQISQSAVIPIEIDTTTTTQSTDIKENKPISQPPVIPVETEEEKRLKKRNKLIQKINEYTKDRLPPAHLENSPSHFLRCVFNQPRDRILSFLLDPEVFLDKEVKEFKNPTIYNLLTSCKILYPAWKIYVNVLRHALPKSLFATPPVNVEQLASKARNDAFKGFEKIYKSNYTKKVKETYQKHYSIQECIAITDTTLRSFTILDMRRYEALESNPNWLQPFIKFYPNVTRLHLPFFKFTEDYGKQLQKFSKLKELDMSLCVSSDAKGLKYLQNLTHLFNLFTYEQTHTVINMLNAVEPIPSNVASDSKQDIDSLDSVSPEELAAIDNLKTLVPRKIPTEERMKNRAIFTFTDQTVASFQFLKNLQVLSLGSGHTFIEKTFTKKTLDTIKTLKNIKELYIINACRLSDSDLESLANLELEKFSIAGWKKITDAGIAKILTLFPKLKELWIGDNAITISSIRLLVAHSKRKESKLETVYIRQPLSIANTKEYRDISSKHQAFFIHI